MISGSIRTFPVEDLLAWLVRRGPSGLLTIERGAAVRHLRIDGAVVSRSSSNLPGEQLGQLLLGRGLIDDAGLAEAFRVAGETGVRFGKILELTEVIGEAELRGVLADRIREAVCDVLTWTEGDFRFEPGDGDADLELEVEVELADAFADGLVQRDRRRVLLARVPDGDATYWRAGAADEAIAAIAGAGMDLGGGRSSRRVDSAGEHARLLAGIERGLTVNQLVLEHNGNRLAVLEGLVALLDAGAIRLDRRAARRAPREGLDAEGVATAARGRAAGGDRAGAWRLSRAGLERHPDSAPLRELHARLERGLLAELGRELLAAFRVPRVVAAPATIAAAALDDAERYVLGRVDGQWDLMSLLRVAPLGELEALLAFRSLAARGLIEL